MVVGSGIARALVCIVMIDDVDSLLLFPEAFALLVLSKGYHVAKSALVPTVVRDDRELVQANSKLSLLSGIVGFVAFVPGVIASAIADAEGVLVLAVGVFALAAIFGLAIPATQVAPLPATAQERAELRGGTIVLAASAMGLMRGIVGFLTLLLAFDLRGDDAPPWHFGVVLALSAIGSLLGALLAPRLRQSAQEENILLLLLGGAFACGLAAAWLGGLTGAALLALAVGMSSTGGKLAFDAIVQRDAPDANRGRSFARFETRFQLAWVIGALPPALVDIPARLGFLVVSGVAAFATVSYVLGERTLRQRAHAPTVIQVRPPDEPTAIAPRDPDATNEIAPDPTIIE